jgi:hypothetical protein
MSSNNGMRLTANSEVFIRNAKTNAQKILSKTLHMSLSDASAE